MRLFDQSYSNKIFQLQLNIQLSFGFLRLNLFDPKTATYVGFDEYEFKNKEGNAYFEELGKVLENNWLNKNFNKVRVIWVNQTYTLIPKVLFEDSQKDAFLKFNHTTNKDENTHSLFIDSQDAMLIYSIPKKIENHLNNRIKSYKLSHFAQAYIEAESLSNKKKKERLSIAIEQHQLTIAYLESDRLIFFNSFEIRNSDDVLYFLLYVIEQLSIDREKCPIFLSGKVEKDSELYKLLYTYIADLKFASYDRTINTSAVLQEFPSHYYYTIFNQHLCE